MLTKKVVFNNDLGVQACCLLDLWLRHLLLDLGWLERLGVFGDIGGELNSWVALVVAAVVLDEDLDVCLVADHLRTIRYFVAFVPDCFARCVQEFRVFFERHFHEVNLAFVAALDAVQDTFVVRVELVYDQVDVVDGRPILLLGLISPELLLRNLGLRRLLEVEAFGCLLVDLPLNLLERTHLVEVVLLGKQHIGSLFVEIQPNLVRFLHQALVALGVVFGVSDQRAA